MSGSKSSDCINKFKRNSQSISLTAHSDIYAGRFNSVTLASSQENNLEDRLLAKSTTPKAVHKKHCSLGKERLIVLLALWAFAAQNVGCI